MTRAPDVAQFLIISEESCEATRRALPAHKQNDIDMSVYRANIVVRGVNRPFEEDWWENFNIGDITFQSIGKCSRCKVTTVSPKTLEWDPNMEPVTTLRRLNGNGTKGYLGMHCVRKNNGKLRVGDEVRVVSRRKFPDI